MPILGITYAGGEQAGSRWWGKRRAAGGFSVSGEAWCQVLYARAATYLRPRAVPTVHAKASAAALSAPPRASARTSGVVESKRQADVAAVIVACVEIIEQASRRWRGGRRDDFHTDRRDRARERGAVRALEGQDRAVLPVLDGVEDVLLDRSRDGRERGVGGREVLADDRNGFRELGNREVVLEVVANRPVRKSSSESRRRSRFSRGGDAPRQFDLCTATDSAVARKRLTAVMQT